MFSGRQVRMNNSPWATCVLCLWSFFLFTGAEENQKSAGEPAAANLTRITSDGPLTIDYALQIAEFTKNVLLEDQGGTLRADHLKVTFDATGQAIQTMIANGNVIIDQKEHYSESQRADFDAKDQKLILTGDPIIRKGPNFYAAEVITIFLQTNKVLFEPSARIVVQRGADESLLPE